MLNCGQSQREVGVNIRLLFLELFQHQKLFNHPRNSHDEAYWQRPRHLTAKICRHITTYWDTYTSDTRGVGKVYTKCESITLDFCPIATEVTSVYQKRQRP